MAVARDRYRCASLRIYNQDDPSVRIRGKHLPVVRRNSQCGHAVEISQRGYEGKLNGRACDIRYDKYCLRFLISDDRIVTVDEESGCRGTIQ